MSTAYTPASRPTNTSYTGRTPIANEWWLLLINATDRLLINATDHLIISVASTGTIWTGRIIP